MLLVWLAAVPETLEPVDWSQNIMRITIEMATTSISKYSRAVWPLGDILRLREGG